MSLRRRSTTHIVGGIDALVRLLQHLAPGSYGEELVEAQVKQMRAELMRRARAHGRSQQR